MAAKLKAFAELEHFRILRKLDALPKTEAEVAAQSAPRIGTAFEDEVMRDPSPEQIRQAH